VAGIGHGQYATRHRNGAGLGLLHEVRQVNDTELIKWLKHHDSHSLIYIAGDRIAELKRELNRANQRLGLYMHHASKKKKAKR